MIQSAVHIQTDSRQA